MRLVNWKGYMMFPLLAVKIGDMVHLHSRKGIWTIKKINKNRVTLGYRHHNDDTFEVLHSNLKCHNIHGKNKRKHGNK